jgi:hypothetical protein
MVKNPSSQLARGILKKMNYNKAKERYYTRGTESKIDDKSNYDFSNYRSNIPHK